MTKTISKRFLCACCPCMLESFCLTFSLTSLKKKLSIFLNVYEWLVNMMIALRYSFCAIPVYFVKYKVLFGSL